MDTSETRESRSGADLSNHNSLLEFQIDKTYASLFEAGKRLRATYLSTMLLFALTTLLVFGKTISGNVTVPLLGLGLNRLHAAEVTLVLCAASLFATYLEKGFERILGWKVHELLYQRYGDRTLHWYLYYPSVLSSTKRLAISPSGRMIAGMSILPMVLGIPAVMSLCYIVASASSWAVHSIFACILVIFFLVLTLLVTTSIPVIEVNDPEARANVLELIEQNPPRSSKETAVARQIAKNDRGTLTPPPPAG